MSKQEREESDPGRDILAPPSIRGNSSNVSVEWANAVPDPPNKYAHDTSSLVDIIQLDVRQFGGKVWFGAPPNE
jgi:hypothetical protein